MAKIIRFPVEKRRDYEDLHKLVQIEQAASKLWWDILGQMAYAEMEKLDKEIMSHVDRLRE